MRMKSFLKYFLILLTGICYFSVALEVSEAEQKLNYEKEAHTYIHAEKVTEVYTAKIAKHRDEFSQCINYCHHYLIASERSSTFDLSFFKNTLPPKSNKLYLYHSFFLI